MMLKTSCQQPHLTYLRRDFSLSLMSHALWQGTLYPKGSEGIHLKTIPDVVVYYLPHLELYARNGKNKKGELKGNPMMKATRNEKTLLDFEYEVLQVAMGIEMKMFPMRVTNPCGCAICDFAYLCKSAVAELSGIESTENQEL